MIGLFTHDHYSHMSSIIEPMWDDHYAESARNKELFRLDPDFSVYQSVSQAGNFIGVVAYDDGLAIGYSVSFIAAHPHYKQAQIAWNDLLYVSPAYRQGSAGGRLMVATRAAAKRRGCKAVSWHAKPNTALDRLLAKRMPVNEHLYMDHLR